MQQDTAQHVRKLPFATKALYGVGTIAFGIKDHGFNALLMIYYNQVVGLPAAWVGLAIMIAMVFDAVLDPVVGQWSDSLRSKWGRRHPFMYAAALPVGVSYLFLWMPPAGLSDGLMFLHLLVMVSITRTAIGVYEVPSTALLAEFTQDYHERTTLTSFRFFFGVAGGILMGIFTFAVIFRPSEAYPVALLNPEGYIVYAWIAAPLMFAAMLLSAWGTHKQIPKLSVPPVQPRQPLWRTIGDMCATLFHKANAPLLLGSLFGAMTAGLHSALNIYIATYFWQISSDQIAILTSSALIGIPLAFLVVLPLSKSFGKKWTTISLYAITLLSMASPVLLRLLGLFPGNGDPLLLPMLFTGALIVSSCALAASILIVSMIADVSEQVQLTTGRQSEGVLFSASSLIGKTVSGVGVLVSGVILSLIGFPENAQPGQVAPETIRHLGTWFIVIASIFSSVALISVAFYPVSKDDHAAAVEELARLRAQLKEH